MKDFLDMDLDELAKATTVDKTRWSRYLNRRTQFTEDVIRRTAAELNLTPGEFLDKLEAKRDTWNPPMGRQKVMLRAIQQQQKVSCVAS